MRLGDAKLGPQCGDALVERATVLGELCRIAACGRLAQRAALLAGELELLPYLLNCSHAWFTY